MAAGLTGSAFGVGGATVCVVVAASSILVGAGDAVAVATWFTGVAQITETGAGAAGSTGWDCCTGAGACGTWTAAGAGAGWALAVAATTRFESTIDQEMQDKDAQWPRASIRM